MVLLAYTARFTAFGRTTEELQAHATVEFGKLFDGRSFSMTVTGPAEPDIVFGAEQAKGDVWRWKQEYEASCPSG